MGGGRSGGAEGQARSRGAEHQPLARLSVAAIVIGPLQAGGDVGNGQQRVVVAEFILAEKNMFMHDRARRLAPERREGLYRMGQRVGA
ncbi:hypothetical protein D3C87_2016020 [compost metagenome]